MSEWIEYSWPLDDSNTDSTDLPAGWGKREKVREKTLLEQGLEYMRKNRN